MLERLREFICDFASVEPASITEDVNIREGIPMDSMSFLNLIIAIEDEFNIVLTQDEIRNVVTVGDFIRLIESK